MEEIVEFSNRVTDKVDDNESLTKGELMFLRDCALRLYAENSPGDFIDQNYRRGDYE